TKLESRSNNLPLGACFRRTINRPAFSPMEKLIKINIYQQARTTNAPKSRRAGLLKPLRKTPKLGKSQAARLPNMAVIDTTDGLRMALEGQGMFIFDTYRRLNRRPSLRRESLTAYSGICAARRRARLMTDNRYPRQKPMKPQPSMIHDLCGPDFRSGGTARSTTWIRGAALPSSMRAASYCFASNSKRVS